MNKTLTLGSLFDGSGTFPMAGILSGITPIWASEIEAFPIRVTTKRLPKVMHLGDISQINGADIEPVDIITFGSPCTDLSVAGKRAGLNAERSGLFFQAVRIINEMRCATNGKYPRFAVWENVGGAFSSNGGEDFRCVLEELCKIKAPDISVPKPEKWTKAGEILGDDFSVAYRTFDAQYWYTPQRRVRIYLVADFDGGCAPKILFESEGLSGYSAEGVRAWKEAARSIADRSGTAGAGLVFSNHGQDTRFKGPVEVAETISASYGTGGNNQPFVVESAGFCTEHSAKARGIGFEEETSPTLRAGVVPATLKIRCGHGIGGRGALIQKDKSATLSCNNDQTLFVPTAFSKSTQPHSVAEAETWKDSETANTLNTFDTGETRANELIVQAYGICAKHSNSMMSDNPNSGFYEADTARTIDTSNQSPCKNQGGMVVIEGNGSRPSHHGDGYKESDTMYTLNCTENHAVSYGIGRPAMNQAFNANFSFQIEEEKSPTIVASGAGGVSHPKYSTSKNSHHTVAEKEKANTLVASDYKDPPVVNDSTPEIEYIVRRLTPQECALLQGMPTWWCDGLETENPTDEEIDWWYDVFKTHRKAMGKSTKPKSRKLVEKWLKNPYSDSAAYKMWGNGVYVGNAWFVLAGIAYYANLGANCERTDTKADD